MCGAKHLKEQNQQQHFITVLFIKIQRVFLFNGPPMKTTLHKFSLSLLLITIGCNQLVAFTVDISRKSCLATKFHIRQQCNKSQHVHELHSSSDNAPAENDFTSNTNNSRSRREINYLDNTRFDYDSKPRRMIRKSSRLQPPSKNNQHANNNNNTPNIFNSNTNTDNHYISNTNENSIERKFSAWGVEKLDQNQEEQIKCPNTVHSVAKNCFHAISSTLYCRNKLDPNIASNAMAISVNDKRPVGFAYWPEGRDVGRLGVEIDHARFLISDQIAGNLNRRKKADVEGRALRRVVLLLATKLSQMPWIGLEDLDDHIEEDDDHSRNGEEQYINNVQNNNDVNSGHHHEQHHHQQNQHGINESNEQTKTRPIALYFNTLNQALKASSELQLLKQIAHQHNQDISIYQNIRILCLGQDTIPDDMIRKKMKNTENKHNEKRRKKWGASRELSSGTVDPRNGMVIVVQPSDFNFESKPPGPSYGTVHDLQKLLSRASVNQIPSVVISPRLTEQMEVEGLSGIEQSGYQKSSTYGGVEPPRGPTPWLLRDFIPPVYSWVGCALELVSRRPSPLAIRESLLEQQHHDDDNNHQNNEDEDLECTVSYYSRVVMTQSVMESGHPWHLYAVENNVKVCHDNTVEKQETEYQYVASTNPHSGRPSKDLLRDVVSEFI